MNRQIVDLIITEIEPKKFQAFWTLDYTEDGVRSLTEYKTNRSGSGLWMRSVSLFSGEVGSWHQIRGNAQFFLGKTVPQCRSRIGLLHKAVLTDKELVWSRDGTSTPTLGE